MPSARIFMATAENPSPETIAELFRTGQALLAQGDLHDGPGFDRVARAVSPPVAVQNGEPVFGPKEPSPLSLIEINLGLRQQLNESHEVIKRLSSELADAKAAASRARV